MAASGHHQRPPQLEYVANQPNLADFSCPVCHEPVWDALIIDKCEHVFCSACLPAELVKCPVCRGPSDAAHRKPLPRQLKNIVDRFQVICPTCKAHLDQSAFETHSQLHRLHQQSIEATFQLGLRESQSDPTGTKSAKVFALAAQLGHAGAQFHLGQQYDSGHGVDAQDERKAGQLFLSAANQGNADAQEIVGGLYSLSAAEASKYGFEPDMKKAVDMLEAAVRQGHTVAMLSLANMYDKGTGGIQVDTKRALELLETAAKQGNASAMGVAGEWYFYGRGVPGGRRNIAKASEFLTAAAAAGCLKSLTKLGQLQEFGFDMPVNYQKAAEFYAAAAARGSAEGQMRLGLIYCRPEFRDDHKSFALFDAAARQGQMRAKLELGIAYAQGRGVAANRQAANLLFDAVAQHGQADELHELAIFYLESPLMTAAAEDRKKAIPALEAAAQRGHTKAKYKLACFYVTGVQDMVDKKTSKGMEMLEELAAAGDAGSQIRLGVLYDTGGIYHTSTGAEVKVAGIVQNVARARDLFLAASRQDKPEAKFHLGVMYADGREGVVNKDVKKAMELMAPGVSLDKPEAKFRMARLLLLADGTGGVYKDEVKALELLQDAASKGYEPAQLMYRLFARKRPASPKAAPALPAPPNKRARVASSCAADV